MSDSSIAHIFLWAAAVFAFLACDALVVRGASSESGSDSESSAGRFFAALTDSAVVLLVLVLPVGSGAGGSSWPSMFFLRWQWTL